MKVVKEFFTDDLNIPSASKLRSFMALCAAIWFGYIVVCQDKPSSTGEIIVIAFLVAAMAPGTFQKYIQVKFNAMTTGQQPPSTGQQPPSTGPPG